MLLVTIPLYEVDTENMQNFLKNKIKKKQNSSYALVYHTKDKFLKLTQKLLVINMYSLCHADLWSFMV